MDNIGNTQKTTEEQIKEVFDNSKRFLEERDRKFNKKLGRVSNEILSTQKVFEKDLASYKKQYENTLMDRDNDESPEEENTKYEPDYHARTVELEVGENAETKEGISITVGGCTIGKEELVQDLKRKNEDTAYINPEKGIFAVFDGVGGAKETGASELAATLLETATKKNAPKTLAELESTIKDINLSVLGEFNGESQTTATIGRIVDNGSEKKLVYASVGDSRIYLIRNGEATQITYDEGEGKMIYNALGTMQFKMEQSGEIKLKDNDQLLFCTDGITGDLEKDFIPNQEIAKIINASPDPEVAARNLCSRATKIDDRTAVVVKISF